jgi:hypothetical protein
MQPIGCKAYALNTKLQNADKLESRALLGHLVGYQATNIYRIWLPSTDEILVTRDVIFEPTQFFDGYEGYTIDKSLEETINTISITVPQLPTLEEFTLEELQLHQRASAPEIAQNTTQVGGETPRQETPQQNAQDSGSINQLLTPSPSALDDEIAMLPRDETSGNELPGHYWSDNETESVTPTTQNNELYPEIESADYSVTELDIQQTLDSSDDRTDRLNQSTQSRRGRRRGPTGLTGPLSLPNQGDPPPDGYRRYGGETAPNNFNREIDPTAIIEGRRQRRPLGSYHVSEAHFTIASFATRLSEESRAFYLNAFTSHILKQQQPTINTRIHISQAPPLPKHIRQLENHQFESEFRFDMAIEWKNLRLKGCFQRTNRTKETADAEVLPLMWVYTYKTDEDGFITRFKARLVVRGDLQ